MHSVGKSIYHFKPRTFGWCQEQCTGLIPNHSAERQSDRAPCDYFVSRREQEDAAAAGGAAMG